MKKIYLSRDSIIKNMKNNMKVMICIFVIFMVLGGVIGGISAATYSYDRPSVEKEHEVDITTIEKDGGYYYNAVDSIKKKKDYLNAYISYFTQVELSVESREKIEKVYEDLKVYNNNNYKELFSFYKENAAIDGNFSQTRAFYQQKIDNAEEEIDLIKIESQNIKEAWYSEARKDQEMKKLNNEKNVIEGELTFFKKYLSMLETLNQYDAESNKKVLDTMLLNSQQEINKITRNFNGVMADISKDESYEIVYNRYILDMYYDKTSLEGSLKEEDILKNKKNQAIIYAKSIEGLDVKEERFFAAFTFFTLFGIMLALIIGGIYSKGKR